MPSKFKHYFKAVKKDLIAAAKLKKCPTLHMWVKSVTRQLWWSFRNCGGNKNKCQ